MGINEKLMRIQTQIKCPKNLYNSFGKYKYRNAEGICESVKPFLAKENCNLVLEDSVTQVGDRIYIVATAILTDVETGEEVTASALAREELTKKGMDSSQITGTASSYARKYALNGLFLLDDTKDADTDENHIESKNRYESYQKTKEKEEQTIDDVKISKTKVDALMSRCKKDEVDHTAILKYYKINHLIDMTEKQYSHMAQNWSKEFKK